MASVKLREQGQVRLEPGTASSAKESAHSSSFVYLNEESVARSVDGRSSRIAFLHMARL